MSPMLIEAAGLAVRYPTGRLALDNASFGTSAGEFVVVLGANGSGKSTLLRCVAGLLHPTSGSVSVAGTPISQCSGQALREARRAVGMIFQRPNLVQRRSVLSNVMTGALGRHRTMATALGFLPRSEMPLALECLDVVGLKDLAYQRAATLSGGQAQRVSVARALAQQPRVLLADEPVASLDPEAAEDLMRALSRLSRESGLAVLCVLHQPELAQRYADRIIGLRRGRIAFNEPPAALSEQHVGALYENLAA
jgi:phosphonate transport system ATP-binding protein